MQTHRGLANYAWLGFGLLGGLGGLYIWLFMPHNSELETIWQMLFKIAVFVLICTGIALFPNHSRYGYLLVCLPFFGFLGFIMPRISYYGFFVRDILQDDVLTGELYTFLYLLLYPGIVLSITLAYRMGGGSPGNTLKIALTGILLIFSGFLDILWPLVNPVPLPEIVHAQHIKVVLGRFATYREAVIFTLCHIPLLIGIQFLPLDRWLAVFEREPQRALPLSERQNVL